MEPRRKKTVLITVDGITFPLKLDLDRSVEDGEIAWRLWWLLLGSFLRIGPSVQGMRWDSDDRLFQLEAASGIAATSYLPCSSAAIRRELTRCRSTAAGDARPEASAVDEPSAAEEP